jgi:ATP-dependent Clp protease protease subunit
MKRVQFEGGLWITRDGALDIGTQKSAGSGLENGAAASHFIPTVRNEERAMDIVSLLLEHGMLDITGPIDAMTSKLITGELQVVSKILKPREGVRLYINSPGGEVSSGLAIYDSMQLLGTPVSTIVNGTAASMAAILLAGGTRGKRLATPHSLIMIHQPRVGGLGPTDGTEMDIQNTEMQRCKKRLIAILAAHSGKSVEEVGKDVERDLWLTAEDALPGRYGPYGLIDKIITAPEAQASGEED